jgi:hypothetical protein
MRLKLKAKGESRLAPETRFYCSLYLRQQTNGLTLEGVKPTGFDMQLVVGKLVDILAAECNIENYNGCTEVLELSLFGSSSELHTWCVY